MSHVNLSRVNLARVDLRSANLSKADLSGCDVRRADFTGANLQSINLNKAYLRGADLRAADLSGANLSNTDLGRAFLRNANLRDANLTRADLKGANFSLTDLTNANLSDVCWDWATQWANAAGLHKARNVPVALTQNLKLTAAMQLSHGMSLAKNAEIQAAISAYHEAQSLDSELEISGQSWNTLCWFGSLHGDASEVLYACENAVRSDPDNVEFKESRGLARCLIGDIEGALADFQTSLDADSVLSDSERARREYWINMLQAGQNPITLEELEELRRAEECKN
ncbi:MAG: pentapeptide repeat-containing protein [Leptolyngbya sp. SIO3F4]|nr:pentapeptide repeat-containing protein [Leptolyngbya sp. SIO3F4]